MDYLQCEKINTAIRRAKTMLTQRAQEDGIYENFGQEEVRMIQISFIDSSDYSIGEDHKRLLLDNFDTWCQTFNLSTLN